VLVTVQVDDGNVIELGNVILIAPLVVTLLLDNIVTTTAEVLLIVVGLGLIVAETTEPNDATY
jgi:membrane-bound ClpP family serine protease